MYRVAVCEDEPLIAQQNAQMVCHILDGRGMVRDRDYRGGYLLRHCPPV